MLDALKSHLMFLLDVLREEISLFISSYSECQAPAHGPQVLPHRQRGFPGAKDSVERAQARVKSTEHFLIGLSCHEACR